jgi:hypothetical protein
MRLTERSKHSAWAEKTGAGDGKIAAAAYLGMAKVGSWISAAAVERS